MKTIYAEGILKTIKQAIEDGIRSDTSLQSLTREIVTHIEKLKPKEGIRINWINTDKIRRFMRKITFRD